MSLPYHPKQGTIVICDFKGFVPPEMVKRKHMNLHESGTLIRC
jgi:uncharacterized protein YifN (PemK superfamily)